MCYNSEQATILNQERRVAFFIAFLGTPMSKAEIYRQHISIFAVWQAVRV